MKEEKTKLKKGKKDLGVSIGGDRSGLKEVGKSRSFVQRYIS